jgi:hypothetical protein
MSASDVFPVHLSFHVMLSSYWKRRKIVHEKDLEICDDGIVTDMMFSTQRIPKYTLHH